MSTSTSTTVGKNAEDVSVWTTTDALVCGAGGVGAALLVAMALNKLDPPFDVSHFLVCLNIFVVLCLLYFYFNGTDRLVNSFNNKTIVATLAMLVVGANVLLQTGEKLGWAMFERKTRQLYGRATGGYMY
jgi:ribose/xylose/arabinose/galactoside ABC-type transport system permease subunit